MPFRRKKSSSKPANTAQKMVNAASTAGANAVENTVIGANVMVTEGGNVLKRGWARLSRRKSKKKDIARIVDEKEEDHEMEHDHIEEQPSSSGINGINGQGLEKKNFVNRGMDRLRRSFRKSLHLGNNKNRLTAQDSSEIPSASVGAGSKPNAFQPDEASVRNGTCHFQVKYLGSCEVFESRGMEVCEHALKHLRSKNRAVKAVLYVSGDSLRVVDQEASRGLLVDQTVEKVSFCAPDRSNEKGFAYICRDGATKRWMCHGFTATKESGERLSHAVGCSFAICLEKKRKREAEMAVFLTAKNLAEEVNGEFNGSRQNQAYSSFRRQLSIAERRQDPQKAILAQPIPIQRSQSSSNSLIDVQLPTTDGSPASEENSTGKVRPLVNLALFEKQNSVRSPPNVSNSTYSQFKRFNSLRTDMNGKPLFGTLKSLHNEPIYEGDEEWPGISTSQANVDTKMQTSNSVNEFASINESNKENGLTNGWDRSKSTVPCASTVSQTADEWLEDMLKRTTASTAMTNSNYTESVVIKPQPMSSLPPSQPPPPLPPQAVLETPQKSLFTSVFATPGMSSQVQQRTNGFMGNGTIPNGFVHNFATAPTTSSTTPLDQKVDIDFFMSPPSCSTTTTASNSVVVNGVPSSQITNGNPAFLNPVRRTSTDKRKSIEYQILEETDAPPQSPPRVTSPLTQIAEVDIFGQPVFNPVKVEKLTSNQESASGTLDQLPANPSAIPTLNLSQDSPDQKAPDAVNEPDPFDVQWTDQVLESARSSRIATLNRNPFSQESAPVNV
ncbi:unnamed protein product [Bursaphelenchus xylophilus]|uniref:(pine wood nematode) hypothetical protein n=1 Tax=Bursaphelenchus xylophilus TaxID=6326 RepID=A0A1I7RT25_BURXY|nr:unnamed protein product [Bursaphelenchus xylophilus]CAG9122660.1 unnamed protein product [Bursaphelenchus xylophilus]